MYSECELEHQRGPEEERGGLVYGLKAHLAAMERTILGIGRDKMVVPVLKCLW